MDAEAEGANCDASLMEESIVKVGDLIIGVSIFFITVNPCSPSSNHQQSYSSPLGPDCPVPTIHSKYPARRVPHPGRSLAEGVEGSHHEFNGFFGVHDNLHPENTLRYCLYVAFQEERAYGMSSHGSVISASSDKSPQSLMSRWRPRLDFPIQIGIGRSPRGRSEPRPRIGYQRLKGQGGNRVETGCEHTDISPTSWVTSLFPCRLSYLEKLPVVLVAFC